MGDARQAPGIEAVPTTLIGVKRIIRSLREGNTFGALPDQVPSKGEGVWASFFGRPAYTMTLPVKVAHQFDAIRIFAWGVRGEDGWKVEAEGLNNMPGATTATNVREVLRRLKKELIADVVP